MITLSRFIILNYLLLLSSTLLFSQSSKKTAEAMFTDKNPKIDAILDETVWKSAKINEGFTENDPEPNSASAQKSEVQIIYSTTSIYIAAKLYDTASDSILKQLCIRDEVRRANTDAFTVFIDGMYTQQSDFEFTVSAAGVQEDASNGDYIWDAVWKSAVKITEDGWIVEIEIPYSQLRFPKSVVQTWGINFGRYIRRTRERSYWSAIDPVENNRVQQYGLLKGIEKIKPPVRLSMTPYVAGYLSYDQGPTTGVLTPNFSVGADLKYGINESFTLDMSLVPDFGDVQSDNQLLNLSPFEQYFEERRPFFTEGVELLKRANIFYSRRIGSSPSRARVVNNEMQADETLQREARNPQLINALKITGRTKKGLGIGFFNALTAPSNAIFENAQGEERKVQAESFSNYNVVVVDQQFGKNSYVSLINTAVLRFGEFTDALATGTEFRILDKKNVYGVEGSAVFSQRFLDSTMYDEKYSNGYRYALKFKKYSGNFTFEGGQIAYSKSYNIDDLGFNYRNNYIKSEAKANYNVYKPFGPFMRMWSTLDFNHEMLFTPNKFARIQVGGRWGATLRNFLSLGADFRVEPLGYTDYFEARTYAQPWKKPTWSRIGAWFSSDYRKAFALDGDVSYRRYWSEQEAWSTSHIWGASLMPIIRFSDKVNMNLSTELTFMQNNFGYVTKQSNNIGEEQIIFGRRYRRNVVNNINFNYLFNNKMALSLRVRHYWAVAKYNQFYELNPEGGMEAINFTENRDNNFNAFNIDLIYRWRFAPGSELNIVWKNAVLQNGDEVLNDYIQNFGDMFADGQINQFSIKALYFLDYAQVFKKKNKGKRLN